VDFLVVSLVALVASALTLFSGFGLGTLLLPAFLMFFPAELAVGMTAVVHLLNNLFKLALLGKWADRSVVWIFGIPAIVASFMGAWVLGLAATSSPVASYALLGKIHIVRPVNLLMGVLIVVFAIVEMLPRKEGRISNKGRLAGGGLLSGFFGGLSGHQGALRSIVLLRAGLTKESFIATGVVISCLVDVSRIGVYAEHLFSGGHTVAWGLVAAATGSAFVGAVVGRNVMGSASMNAVRTLVVVLLIVVGVGVAGGVL